VTWSARSRRSDRGADNVGTLGRFRRGLATALTAYLVHDSLARGRRAATLQTSARSPLKLTHGEIAGPNVALDRAAAPG
jgi:hypothetical protein